MRCFVGTDWGADRLSLRAMYTVRSLLDYESIVYNTVAETSAKKSDCIQNQALRLCTGVTKSTPTDSLQVEMGEIPLGIRREQLTLNTG